MLRDADLIRLILVQVEKNHDPMEWMDPRLDGYTEEVISYHIMVLDEAGFLEGLDRCAIGVFRWSARNLTWKGHEFLDTARNDDDWQAVKKRVLETTHGLSFSVLADELLKHARAKLGNAG